MKLEKRISIKCPYCGFWIGVDDSETIGNHFSGWQDRETVAASDIVLSSMGFSLVTTRCKSVGKTIAQLEALQDDNSASIANE